MTHAAHANEATDIEAGRIAYRNGVSIVDNPFFYKRDESIAGTQRFYAWKAGWQLESEGK